MADFKENNMFYFDYIKPGAKSTMSNLKLDKQFYSARENYLFYKNDEEKEVKILDFVGGYGSTMLGHNNKELIEHSKKLLTDQTPIHCQLSSKKYGGLLGEKISSILENHFNEKFVTTLTNSGAETVEACFKHMRLMKKQELINIFNKIGSRLNYIDNLTLKNNIVHFEIGEIGYKTFNDFKLAVNELNEKTLSKFKPKILASEGAFHGKTINALKSTYNSRYRVPFLFEGEDRDVIFFKWKEDQIERHIEANNHTLLIPYFSDGTVKAQHIQINSVIGVIIEPILGEGGVKVVPSDFLNFLRAITYLNKIPLAFDEIQCGMFRTGHFLHALKLKIKADHYLIGKSFGGGLVKNGALITRKEVYNEDFCALHTSTFAEDEFSSAISLKTISILEKKKDKISSISAYLSFHLTRLKVKYDAVIDDVLGEGLMRGIKFKKLDHKRCYFLQYISRSGYFNYFLSSFLLNRFHIRLGATLSDSFTLRIQPSVLTDIAQIDSLINSLEYLIKVIWYEDSYILMEHLLPEEYREMRPLKKFDNGDVLLPSSTKDNYRVGFLMHFNDIVKDLFPGDSALSHLPEYLIEDMLNKVGLIQSGIILGSEIITGKDRKVEIIFCGLPFTSKMVRDSNQNNNLKLQRELCHAGIDLLKDSYHVNIVGLGQYTSIITNNGVSIPRSDVSITTGNSFTVYSGLKSLLNVLDNHSQFNYGLYDMAILGAAGNISSVYTKCFSIYANKIYLKGSDSKSGNNKTIKVTNELIQYIFENLLIKDLNDLSPLELKLFKTELFNEYSKSDPEDKKQDLYSLLKQELDRECPIVVFEDLEVLKKCNVVVVATNNPSAFLTEDNFNENTVVLDISVPNNVDHKILDNKNNIKVLYGGIIRLPNNEKLPIRGFPLRDGYAYACISETILMGLERFEHNYSLGTITPKMVWNMREISEKHNFSYFSEKNEILF